MMVKASRIGQIDDVALDAVVLVRRPAARPCGPCLCLFGHVRLPLDQVQQREQEDPHQVDEVPVQAPSSTGT